MDVRWSAPGLEERFAARLSMLERERIVERIWAHDHTVWKREPTEITNRLGWLTVMEQMRPEVPGLRAFADAVWDEGYRRLILLGMGGSSLAAEVLAALKLPGARGLDLLVLDSTDPEEVAAAEGKARDAKTLFLVGSKSGTTIETRCQLDYFWARWADGRDFVAVTDEGTDLENTARERGFREVFVNPSDIGGRFSALSYFGLVPGVLVGFDIDRLLASACNAAERCRLPITHNPGGRLGAVMGEAALAGREKLILELPATVSALDAWIEQLVAESTGKQGTGILPVARDPGSFTPGSDRIWLGEDGDGRLANLPGPTVLLGNLSADELGAEFFVWEFATAVAGAVLAVNPFDQPNVEEAKEAAQRFLDLASPQQEPGLPFQEALETIRPGEYVAILAYVARSAENEHWLGRVRAALAGRYGVPTTLGFGPRYLHSTGQYHKGGPPNGVFIQVLGEDEADLEIPGRHYTFGQLKRAQADGDLAALVSRERRVARVAPAELRAFLPEEEVPVLRQRRGRLWRLSAWIPARMRRRRREPIGKDARPAGQGAHPPDGVQWSAASKQGLARTRNVDAYAVAFRDGRAAFAVADGTGSMPLAGVASKAAAEAAVRLLSTSQPGGLARAMTEDLRESVAEALGRKHSEGATTVVAALLDGQGGIVVAVGDSEAIAVWEPGRVELLNELDHSAENPNVLVSWVDGLFRYQPHVITLEARPPFLCLVSDGVTKVLEYDEIGRIVLGAGAEAAAEQLVQAAQNRGSGDDVTALVIGTGAGS